MTKNPTIRERERERERESNSARPKIVVFREGKLTTEQKSRLEKLGDVTYIDKLPKTGAEYLADVHGADIICSVTAGFAEASSQLRDVFVSFPFVSVAFADLELLRRNNVTVANAPGANKHAVSEWVMCMVILLMRQFYGAINSDEIARSASSLPLSTKSLSDSKMTILGRGNVGQRVAEIAKGFEMNVRFFNRGDDLYDSVNDADVVVNTLSSNPTTIGLLDAKFFAAMKQDSYFVSVSREEIIDDDALIDALDNDHLAGAATDLGDIYVGDITNFEYQRLKNHPKILATPHIAYSATKSERLGNDIMIDNVEKYLAGEPQNIVN